MYFFNGLFYNEGVRLRTRRWRWFRISEHRTQLFLYVLRSETSATGFVAGSVPHCGRYTRRHNLKSNRTPSGLIAVPEAVARARDRRLFSSRSVHWPDIVVAPLFCGEGERASGGGNTTPFLSPCTFWVSSDSEDRIRFASSWS